MLTSKTEPQIRRIGGEVPPVYEDRWLRLYHEPVRFPDESCGEYNRIVEGPTGSGVACVPISPDGRLGLIRVYRYPISQHMWEIVRGYADSIDLEQEAARELEEELGYSHAEVAAARQVNLGAVYPNSGLLATRLEVFAFVGLEGRNQRLCSDRGMVQEVRFLLQAEITEWIRKGMVSDAITLAALALVAYAGITVAPVDMLWLKGRSDD